MGGPDTTARLAIAAALSFSGGALESKGLTGGTGPVGDAALAGMDTVADEACSSCHCGEAMQIDKQWKVE